MPIFYVYAYLKEDGTPFYIGKGQKNRINIQGTRKFELPPADRRVKLFEGLGEQEALDKERELIEFYGKENLINKTTGGQGISGLRFKMDPEVQKKKNEHLRKLYADPEFAARHRETCMGNNKGAHRSEEQREKIRKGLTAGQVWRFLDPEGKEVIVEGSLNKWCKETKLNTGAMSQVHLGKTNHHKGWTKL